MVFNPKTFSATSTRMNPSNWRRHSLLSHTPREHVTLILDEPLSTYERPQPTCKHYYGEENLLYAPPCEVCSTTSRPVYHLHILRLQGANSTKMAWDQIDTSEARSNMSKIPKTVNFSKVSYQAFLKSLKEARNPSELIDIQDKDTLFDCIHMAYLESSVGTVALDSISTSILNYLLSHPQDIYTKPDVQKLLDWMKTPNPNSVSSRFNRLVDWISDKCPKSCIKLLLKHLASFLRSMKDGAVAFTAFCNTLKPAVLTALLNSYDGSREGFIAVTFSILQLYGISLRATAELLIDVLSEAYSKLMSLLNFRLQNTSYLAVLVGLFVLYLSGRLTPKQVTTLRNFGTITLTVTSLYKLWKFVSDYLSEARGLAKVKKLVLKTTTLAIRSKSPEETSSYERRQALVHEVDQHFTVITNSLVEPSMLSFQSILRNCHTLLLDTKKDLASLTVSDALRDPALILVFTGMPGIGKTEFVKSLASSIGGGYSNFTLTIDHHDTYTGKPIAIWDELDAPPAAGSYIEAVISMGSGAPYVLNCDNLSSKGKLFCSKVVLATSNLESLVAPNHPRAHAFLRRITVVDVSAPQISDHLKNNPGTKPPKTLFQKDFSHLRFSIRPYLAIDSKGNTLTGVAKNMDVSLKEIRDMISTRLAPDYRPQGPQPATYLYAEKPGSVHKAFDEYFTLTGSFVRCHIDDGKPVPNSPGLMIVLTDDKSKPHVSLKKNPVMSDNLNDVFDCSIDLSVFNEHSTLVVNSNILLSVTDLVPNCENLPVYKVSCVEDFVEIVQQIYGWRSWVLLWRFWRVKRVDDSLSSILHALISVSFPEKPYTYYLLTPLGKFWVHTNGGILIRATNVGGASLPTPVDGDFEKKTPWQLFKLCLKYIGKMFLNELDTIGHLTATSYMLRLRQPRLQGATRPNLASRILTDTEYDGFVESRKTFNDLTIAQYIHALDMLEKRELPTDTRTKQLVDFLATLRLQGPDVPYALLMDSSGVALAHATNLGCGNWVCLKHTIQNADRIFLEGKECFVKKFEGELCYLSGPTCPGNRPLSADFDKVPVTFDGRPVSEVKPLNTLVNGSMSIGLVCRVTGGTLNGECGKPYLNSSGQIVALHAGDFQSTGQAFAIKIFAKKSTWHGLAVCPSPKNQSPLPKGTTLHALPGCELTGFEPAAYGAADPRILPTQEEILATNLVPYLTPSKNVPDDLLSSALTCLIKIYETRFFEPGFRAVILNESTLYRQLDFSTSCGPWVPGLKKDYLESGLIRENSPLASRINFVWDSIMNGNPVPIDYKLNLKDELRPTAKVAKKRLIWATDVGITAAAARIYGMIFDAFKRTCLVGPCSVGVNLDSRDAVRAFLDRFSNTGTGLVLQLDYSKWDSTMPTSVIHAAYEFLHHFCEPTLAAKTLLRSLCGPHRGFFGDKIVIVQQGLCSGTPGTSYINSLCHSMLFSMAIWMTEDACGVTRSINPLERYQIATYGDDCIYPLDAFLYSNISIFVSSLKALGLSPTAVDKTDNITPEMTLNFLKRTWVENSGSTYAALPKEVLIRQCYYYRSGKTFNHNMPGPIDKEERTNQLIEVLIAAAPSGPDVFAEVAEHVSRAFQQHGLPNLNYGYHHCLSIYDSRFNANLHYKDLRLQGVDGQTNEDSAQSPAAPVATPNIQANSPGAAAPIVPYTLPVPASETFATAGTGVGDPVPSLLANNFIRIATFGWNNAMPRNTLLGSVSLDPTRHPWLNQLMACYGGWSGSFILRIMVSASGTYGGRICASILPPSVEPAEVSNPLAYPSDLLDARSPEALDIPLPDVRSTSYHVFGSGDAVSTCAIYVIAPLINPFSGTSPDLSSGTDILVMAVPGPDFRFTLPREPTLNSSSLVSRVFGQSTMSWRANRTGTLVTSLVAVRTARFAWNHWDVNGRTTGWGNNDPAGMVYLQPQVAVNLGNSPSQLYAIQCVGATPDNTATVSLPTSFPDWISFNPLGTGAHDRSQFSPAASGLMMLATGSNLDIDETKIFGVIFGYGVVTLNGSAANSYSYAPSSTVGSGSPYVFVVSNFTQNVTTSNLIMVKGGAMQMSSAGQAYGSSALVTPNTPAFYSVGGNSVLLFRSSVPGTYPSSSTVDSGQPLLLSDVLSATPMTIGDGSMAVFRLSSPSHSFEIGLTPQGYVLGPGSTDVVMQLNSSSSTTYNIEFVGFTSQQTALSGTLGASASSRSRWH